jgi:hypothetical protein
MMTLPLGGSLSPSQPIVSAAAPVKAVQSSKTNIQPDTREAVGKAESLLRVAQEKGGQDAAAERGSIYDILA